MEKKITYAQALTVAIKTVEDVEVRDRLADLKASLEKKASSKKKTDNSALQTKVIEILAEGAKTPSELVSLLGVDNTQKVAGVCKPLIEDGTIIKTVKGKKTTYELA